MKRYQHDVSIVVPLYNEDESLPELCSWIERVMQEAQLDYEVILVDDGSTDKSWHQINKISRANERFRGLRFNRNYGKSAALNKGFKSAMGRVVITMDADMQDSPDEVPELVTMITEDGYDMVSGWKKKRYDPISKTVPSKFFNFVTRVISGIKLHDFNCGLKAYRVEVVKSIDVYGEMHRYIPVLAHWKGFKNIGEKEVQHRKRKYGTTKFGLSRFLFGFLDLLSVIFVSRFRKKPMHFFGSIGTLSFLIGLIFVIKLVWDKLDSVYFSGVPMKRDIVDQPIFYLALVAVVIGAQLFLTGFMGELINFQDPAKNDYLVIEEVNFPD